MGICYSSTLSSRNNNNNGTKQCGISKADSKLKRSSGSVVGGGVVAPEEQAPGRLAANGASAVASLYTQQGKKGTNQDAMIAWENFYSLGNESATFCGVFDGHGPYGHMVARKVRDVLPSLIRTQWEKCNDDEKSLSQESKDFEGTRRFDDFTEHNDGYESIESDHEMRKIPEAHIPLKNSIMRAFKSMDNELRSNPSIDCFCSGTTAVTLIKQGQDLIIGNVGDSRAVLATRDNNDDSLTAVQLTVDLKPNLPREHARIEKCKGRVFALQDEPEVARVWLPNSNSPGLAMARAFGDFCLKEFGLISTPDVYHHRIAQQDEFIVLATDGVWDVLSNKEAVDIVSSAPGRSTSARALVDCATRAWRLKYPTSKIDDCAVVCLFLDKYLPCPNESSKSQNDKILQVPQCMVEDGNITSQEEKKHEIITTKVEIVPVIEERSTKEKTQQIGQSMRSLAECLSIDEEEWSALEGITRVNSLLSVPRFVTNWRKWL